MSRFNNAAERDAWALAEALVDKGRTMMQRAEVALETFMVGKELNLQRCVRRGIGPSDAEIRWSETDKAKKAIADNTFHVNQAVMYYSAAAAHYSRAVYLRSHGGPG